ncbi:MAG: pirin family protein [Tissierellales bacterium]|nr:pirin family protein [Tissierellales bacterium]HCX04136.1 pirin family protein [Clostridiales bacterium]
MKRVIKKKYPGTISQDGAGVKLNRIFSRRDVEEVDPFLLLDFFDSDNKEDYIKGFPWHPHRGIETITYLIEGELEHGDSLGNSGTIEPYGCQWMTAGSGIVHQEMPQPSKRMLGAQLWLNLPKKNKMTEPAYRDITVKDLITHEDNNSKVNIICGEYKGLKGPVRGTYVDPIYFDVEIKPGKTFKYTIDEKEKVFLLMIKGSIEFSNGDTADFSNEKGVLLTQGDEIEISSEKGSRFLLFAGKPLKEPIAWGGPIVMNTQEELSTAFKELDEGTFIK